VTRRLPRTWEEFLAFTLIVVTVAWLLLTVVAPLGEVARRSMVVEVPVAIFGPEDVRIGGRRVFVEDGEVTIDGEAVDLTDGVVEAEGVHARLSDDGFSHVDCGRVLVNARPTRVRPVAVRIDDETWTVDGEVLTEDQWQRVVSRYVGWAVFREYFSNAALSRSLFNSLYIATVASLIAVVMAFLYAYALARTRMPFKAFFRVAAMLPLFAPTMLYGLSLVYLFGNKGVITTGFFGHLPWLAWDIQLYGPVGIIIAESAFIFPPAALILMVALSNTDARLYEAAAAMGASPWRQFTTVTLPGARFGLINAVFVCFTMVFTDFGAPKIVGGNYSVLAVDIYKQVVGQQNFSMGAVVSMLLLVPAVLSFVVQQTVNRRHHAAVTAQSVPYTPPRRAGVDYGMLAVCTLVCCFLLLLVFMAGVGSLVKNWPYDLTPSLAQYRFDDVGGGGYASLWNSVVMSIATAMVGTLFTFGSAYLIEKQTALPLLRRFGYFLSILPLAVPGLVIGIAYILFFNRPEFSLPLLGWRLPNPFVGLYQTMAIMVVANVVHFYTVSFLTAMGALRELDREFETVSASMAVPFWTTFRRVTFPVSVPAVIEIAAYYFVSSMTTVSAVIFLYGADTRVASVAVVNMDDAGDTAAASAMCILIVGVNVLVRCLFEAAAHGTRRRTQHWRRR